MKFRFPRHARSPLYRPRPLSHYGDSTEEWPRPRGGLSQSPDPWQLGPHHSLWRSCVPWRMLSSNAGLHPRGARDTPFPLVAAKGVSISRYREWKITPSRKLLPYGPRNPKYLLSGPLWKTFASSWAKLPRCTYDGQSWKGEGCVVPRYTQPDSGRAETAGMVFLFVRYLCVLSTIWPSLQGRRIFSF